MNIKIITAMHGRVPMTRAFCMAMKRVEKEFGIQVANEDLDFDNFKSLNAIVGFIENKSGTAG